MKASKSSKGEKIRVEEVSQLLDQIDLDLRLCEQSGHPRPAVIITGDLNATPQPQNEANYSSEAYALIKSNSLGLRSVLNDDLIRVLTSTGTSYMILTHK